MSDFDRWIGDKLDDHSAKLPEDAWDRFAQQWPEGQSRDDKAFERFLQDRLHHHHIHHTEAARATHWKSLRMAMDRLRDRTLEIFLTKGIEIGLVFLICFYGWPIITPDETPSGPVPYMQQDQLPSERANRASEREPMASLDHKSTLNNGSELAENASFKAKQSIPTETLNIFPPSSPMIPPFTTEEEIHLAEGFAIVLSGDIIQHQEDLESAEIAPILDNNYVDQHALGQLTPVVRLAVSEVENGQEVALPSPFTNTEKRYFHKVHMAFNADAHYIVTPYDHLLIKRGYDQIAGGYGAAIGYSWEGQKWGLRTQVGFRHLNYLPKPYTEVFDGDVQRGYFTETLRNINLNMVTASLYGTRYLTHGEWRWYALAGGSMQIAFQANYDRKQRYLPGADPVGGTPEPQNQSLTSQKKYSDGIFEGGSLEENYFITLDIGAGLERHINGRISIFAEPVYHHNPFRRSLGPNSDRINTLSVFTGVRVLL